ncbi:MAG: hypothetical protein AAB426_10495 [Myxococcota bacterium]
MLRRALMTVTLASALVLGGCGAGADYLAACAADTECFEGYACAPEEPGAAVDICLRACTSGVDCLQSQYCDIPNGESSGVCRFGEAP